MKDMQNVTIVLLLITAVILAVVLIATYQTEPAYADTPTRGGDYILGTGAWSKSRDLVYVIDRATRTINVYAANINTNVIDLVDQQNLERVFRLAETGK